MTTSDQAPFDPQIFRCWVELRDLRDGTTRDLPATCVTQIVLATKSKATSEPNRMEIHVQDGSHTWIAAEISDLSAQLRTQYPDGAFERTLKCERDVEAEQRRRAAIQGLIEILARAAVDEYMNKR